MGERICSNCAHCNVGPLSMYCHWEINYLPPPVMKKRNWGNPSVETWESAAKDCPHFHHRIKEG